MKETELAQPVATWLNKKGYIVYSEIPALGRCIDIIGIKDEKIIAVELKLNLTKEVIYQANTAGLVSHEAYVAVASKPRWRSVLKCEKAGLGVLSLRDGYVSVLAKSNLKQLPLEYYVKKIHEQVEYIEPGVYAGKPNEKGVGPAQDCLRRIKEYLKEHPEASWIEIYTNVDNHYDSCNSMQSSMRTWCHFKKSRYLFKRTDALLAQTKLEFK